MKHSIVLLLCGLFTKTCLSQSNISGLHFGKYEGIELIYFKQVSDTSARVDRMNETWGKKTLTIDSNGTFLLEFPVPHPTTAVDLKRAAKGRWFRVNDTLVLNSYHPYSNFIKVEERKINSKRIQVKLKYIFEGKEYHPPLSVRVNNKEEKMVDTERKRWTHFPLDTVDRLLIEYWVGPTSTYREWVYRPSNRNSNSFIITAIDNGDADNFVFENYKLLIVGSSLMQVDKVFYLRENCFKATNFR